MTFTSAKEAIDAKLARIVFPATRNRHDVVHCYWRMFIEHTPIHIISPVRDDDRYVKCKVFCPECESYHNPNLRYDILAPIGSNMEEIW